VSAVRAMREAAGGQAVERMLVVENVVHRYGDVEARKVPTFRAVTGEQWLVTGPSGSGKTTLLQIISGILSPSEGRVAAVERVRYDHTRGKHQTDQERRTGSTCRGRDVAPCAPPPFFLLASGRLREPVSPALFTTKFLRPQSCILLRYAKRNGPSRGFVRDAPVQTDAEEQKNGGRSPRKYG
jgi:energy-coupling factor transporter ATP-binding protein EcfA2